MTLTLASGQVAPEQHQELVAVHHPPVFVHRADAIAVAVEGDPQLAALADDGGLEVLERLDHRGIGVMVGKRPIRLRVQRDHVGAEPAQRVDRDETRHAVAAVHGDFHAAGERGVALHDRVAVGGEDARRARLAALGTRLDEVVLEHLTQVLEILAKQRLAAQHDLEPVELGRVV